MCKILDFKQFMMRQEVLKLYREIFRSIRLVPDVKTQNDLKQWARFDFKLNKTERSEQTIKMLLLVGKKTLKELQTNLNLSGGKNE